MSGWPAHGQGKAVVIDSFKKDAKEICKACGGKGYTEYYHDAGDHFGAGTSPFSEWVRNPCKACKSTGKILS